MKRARTMLFVVVAAAGCRGILGIEPLQVVDAGSDGGATDEDATASDANASKDGDGGGKDASGDASSPDAASPPFRLADGAPPADSGCQYETPCQPCCRSAFAAGYVELEQVAIDAGCLCGADDAGCTSACSVSAQDFCAEPQNGGTSPCFMCLDMMLAKACAPVLAQCTSADCINARSCLASCGPPP